ncbi:hypothetical protein [Nocardioides sp.]|uniref:hypothetical protein n=1 Tax=Nocardioides sp. TaxID=35761 RepID=UPI00273308C7|nr:hypothetical protein [Nocardioides sp.]MDP3892024.1 hypothetical protein [Nocardioides sp.]
MKGKLILLTGAAAGYVLGTKAGRQRYEQIKRAAGRVKDDPRVQEKAHQAADLAREKAPIVADRVTEVAQTAAEKARSAVPGGHSGAHAGGNGSGPVPPGPGQ